MPEQALSAEERIRYFGTDEPLPDVRRLAVGPFSADLVEGNLRTIRYDGREIIRAISYIVRDKDWGTYVPEISGLDIRNVGERLFVTYNGVVTDGKSRASVRYATRIEIDPAGRLVFAVDAVPDADFETNRCGFCVLHPIVGVAGQPVEVEHIDGRRMSSVFPDQIDPAQPFMGMRAITHWAAPDIRVECRMEGDAFEMEDQRNWTDASYKTYIRPLALPWPYVLPKGVINRQVISLDIADTRAGRGDAVAASAEIPVVAIDIGDVAGTLPKLGLVITPEETAATLSHGERLGELAPGLLLLHFDPTMGHGLQELRSFQRVAELVPGTEVTLECVVPCVEALDVELTRYAGWVRAAGLKLDAIAVSPSVDRKSTPPGSVWPDCPPLEEVYAAARKVFPGLRLGGGMFSYFTELNRKRPPVELLDFVTHSTAPIVHAADDLSVMQTLEALPFITRSARAIIGEAKPYRIGPSTIGMRQNPYGAGTLPNPDNKRLPMAKCDPRQCGQFAGAFMIGYVAETAPGQLEALTVGALTGPFGLINEDGTARPAFDSARALSRLSGQLRSAVRSSAPQTVAAIAADGTILLANLTSVTQWVRVGSVEHPLEPFEVKSA